MLGPMLDPELARPSSRPSPFHRSGTIAQPGPRGPAILLAACIALAAPPAPSARAGAPPPGRVTVTTAKDAYARGERVTIRVHNGTKVRQLIAPTPYRVERRTPQGWATVIFDSCAGGPPPAPFRLALAPGASAELDWGQVECRGGRSVQAAPGTYRLVLSVDGPAARTERQVASEPFRVP